MANDVLSSLFLVAKSNHPEPAASSEPYRKIFLQEEQNEWAVVMPPRAQRSNARRGTPNRSSRARSPSSIGGSSVLTQDPLGRIRSPLVQKYSVSYGSPLIQLPDRGSTGDDAGVAAAAAAIFQQVRQDNRDRATAGSRNGSHSGASARAASVQPPPPPEDDVDLVQDPDESEDELAPHPGDKPEEEAGEEEEEAEEEVVIEVGAPQNEVEDVAPEEEENEGEEGDEQDEETGGEEDGGEEEEGEGEEEEEEPVDENMGDIEEERATSDNNRSTAAERAAKAASDRAKVSDATNSRKRPRDDQTEAELELERIEREAQQRRDRLAEARRQAEERRARVLASEQRRRPQQTTGLNPTPETPFGGSLLDPRASGAAPDTSRSWREESAIFGQTHLTGSPNPAGPPPPPNPNANVQLPPTLQPPVLWRPGQNSSGPNNNSAFVPRPRNSQSLSWEKDPNSAEVTNDNLPDPRPNGRRDDVAVPRDRPPSRPSRERNRLDGSDDGSRHRANGRADSRRKSPAREDPEDDDPSDGASDVSSESSNSNTHIRSIRNRYRRYLTLWNLFKLLGMGLILFPVLNFIRYADFLRAFSPASPILTDEQFRKLHDLLNEPHSLTDSSRDNLKYLLPRIIHVQRDRNGRLIIDNEFWHAIKCRIQEDNSILSVDDQGHLSPDQLQMLLDQLPTDSAQPTSQSWDTWLRQNHMKVTNLIGKDINQIISDKLPANVVSRDDFVHELESALAQQKDAMASSIDNIKSTINTVLDDVSKLKHAPKSGLSESDLTKVVDKIVNKAISKTQLKHAAQAGLTSSLLSELDAKLNHFSQGNGAIIESSLTSPTFRMRKRPRIGSLKWLQAHRVEFKHEAFNALLPWSEPGDCWCGGTLGDNNNTFPVDIAVELPGLIIPEYVVLEHINPEITTDPDSMPKDVEIWAKIFEPRRLPTEDWAIASFPRTYTEPDVHDRRAVGNNLVKLGEFRYTWEESRQGVWVQRLSEQLVSPLQAATDMILVRAKTNQGGVDHTCFYRVRVFGEEWDVVEGMKAWEGWEQEEVVQEPEEEGWKKGWRWFGWGRKKGATGGEDHEEHEDGEYEEE